MSMSATPLLYSRDGGIAHIRFNRPSVLNALDVATAKAFRDACRRATDEDGIRVVVISGEGRAFVAGGDLAQLRSDPYRIAGELIAYMHEAVTLLTNLDAPVIASVHGSVAGAGLSLALACDLTVAAEGTRFNLAYVNVAASCDVSGSWHLVRHVGLRRALEIAFLGETITAEDALRFGLVNRLVPAEQLVEATDGLAKRLAAGPTAAYGRLKNLLRASMNNDLQTQLDTERDCFLASTLTSDFAEALNAFHEKRSPHFVGR